MMGSGLKGLADILAIKRSAGFTPEVILRKSLHCTQVTNIQVMDQPELQVSGLMPSKINKIHDGWRQGSQWWIQDFLKLGKKTYYLPKPA